MNINSVLDVGCGEGHSTKYFKDLGCDVIGIDGSIEAHQDSVIPDFHFVHDFTEGPFMPAKIYDMVWSCEFVEHVEECFVNNIIKTFGCADKYLIMTHAFPGQEGHHHVNCQPTRYWVKKMYEIGFAVNIKLTIQSRKAAGHGYYAGSGLVFARRTSCVKLIPANIYSLIKTALLKVWYYYQCYGLVKTLDKIIKK